MLQRKIGKKTGVKSVLLLALAALVLFAVPALAGAAEVTITANKSSVVVEEEFDLIVDMSEVSDLYGASIDLTYDPDKVEVLNVVNVPLGEGGMIPDDQIPLYVDGEPVLENGEQVYVTLRQALAYLGTDLFTDAANGDGTRTASFWYTRVGEVDGVNGSGHIFKVFMRAVQAGPLSFTYGDDTSDANAIIKLASSQSDPIAFTVSGIPVTVTVQSGVTVTALYPDRIMQGYYSTLDLTITGTGLNPNTPWDVWLNKYTGELVNNYPATVNSRSDTELSVTVDGYNYGGMYLNPGVYKVELVPAGEPGPAVAAADLIVDGVTGLVPERVTVSTSAIPITISGFGFGSDPDQIVVSIYAPSESESDQGGGVVFGAAGATDHQTGGSSGDTTGAKYGSKDKMNTTRTASGGTGSFQAASFGVTVKTATVTSVNGTETELQEIQAIISDGLDQVGDYWVEVLRGQTWLGSAMLKVRPAGVYADNIDPWFPLALPTGYGADDGRRDIELDVYNLNTLSGATPTFDFALAPLAGWQAPVPIPPGTTATNEDGSTFLAYQLPLGLASGKYKLSLRIFDGSATPSHEVLLGKVIVGDPHISWVSLPVLPAGTERFGVGIDAKNLQPGVSVALILRDTQAPVAAVEMPGVNIWSDGDGSVHGEMVTVNQAGLVDGNQYELVLLVDGVPSLPWPIKATASPLITDFFPHSQKAGVTGFGLRINGYNLASQNFSIRLKGPGDSDLASDQQIDLVTDDEMVPAPYLKVAMAAADPVPAGSYFLDITANGSPVARTYWTRGLWFTDAPHIYAVQPAHLLAGQAGEVLAWGWNIAGRTVTARVSGPDVTDLELTATGMDDTSRGIEYAVFNIPALQSGDYSGKLLVGGQSVGWIDFFVGEPQAQITALIPEQGIREEENSAQAPSFVVEVETANVPWGDISLSDDVEVWLDGRNGRVDASNISVNESLVTATFDAGLQAGKYLLGARVLDAHAGMPLEIMNYPGRPLVNAMHPWAVPAGREYLHLLLEGYELDTLVNPVVQLKNASEMVVATSEGAGGPGKPAVRTPGSRRLEVELRGVNASGNTVPVPAGEYTLVVTDDNGQVDVRTQALQVLSDPFLYGRVTPWALEVGAADYELALDGDNLRGIPNDATVVMRIVENHFGGTSTLITSAPAQVELKDPNNTNNGNGVIRATFSTPLPDVERNYQVRVIVNSSPLPGSVGLVVTSKPAVVGAVYEVVNIDGSQVPRLRIKVINIDQLPGGGNVWVVLRNNQVPPQAQELTNTYRDGDNLIATLQAPLDSGGYQVQVVAYVYDHNTGSMIERVVERDLFLQVGGAPSPQLTISTYSLPTTTQGQPYSATLTANGGLDPYTWYLGGSSNLPEGLQLNSETGVISGTPTVAGDFIFTVLVFDNANSSASRTTSLTINPSTPPPGGGTGTQIRIEAASQAGVGSTFVADVYIANLTGKNLVTADVQLKFDPAMLKVVTDGSGITVGQLLAGNGQDIIRNEYDNQLGTVWFSIANANMAFLDSNGGGILFSIKFEAQQAEGTTNIIFDKVLPALPSSTSLVNSNIEEIPHSTQTKIIEIVGGASVSGRVLLQGRSANENKHGGTVIILSMLDGSISLETQTGEDGIFNLSGIPTGQYRVTAVRAKYIKKDLTILNITSAEPVVIQTVTLLAGDTDGDNMVFTLDVTRIKLNYGKTVTNNSPSDSIFKADLDEDGIVYTKDITMVKLNYGRSYQPLQP